jgi:hypothetical protein
LECLSDSADAALLEKLGVRGSLREREQLASDFKGMLYHSIWLVATWCWHMKVTFEGVIA